MSRSRDPGTSPNSSGSRSGCRGHGLWTPPLRRDEERLFDPRRNRAHAYCDCALWLARDGRGTTVGRIAGIINRRYNEARDECTGRFSHLECVESLDVASTLLDRVREWAGVRGMNRIIGPLGFTDQDPEGLLIEGFDEEPSVASRSRRSSSALCPPACDEPATIGHGAQRLADGRGIHYIENITI